MTRTSTNARPLLILVAALATTPLAAREPMIVAGEAYAPVYRERVSFSDLDLRDARARRVLVLRVEDAATDVCIRAVGKHNVRFRFTDPAGSCFDQTYRAARPQLMAAIQRARAGQAVAATSLVLSAPAR